MERIYKKNLLIAALSLLAVLEAAALILLAACQPFQTSETPFSSLPPVTETPTAPVPEFAPASEEPEHTLSPAVSASTPSETLSAADILAESPVVAHGMGAVNEVHVLNCLEAFEAQYANGVRVFEVDFRLTSDLQVVLRHDWRAGWQDGISETYIPTLEEFLSKPILEKYTPLSFRDLLLLMEQYPDICIITDTKFTDPEIITLQFEAMLQDAEDLGLNHLFDRMVIQLYSPLMFKIVDNIHHFPHYIYTLYSVGFDCTLESFEEIAAYCQENGIAGVTMWVSWWDASFAPVAEQYGISVYAHTTNDAEAAKVLLDEGVSAVYTDRLGPGDVK